MKNQNNCYSICYFSAATFATLWVSDWYSLACMQFLDSLFLSAKPPCIYLQGGFLLSATLIATFIAPSKTMKPYIEAKLYKRKGDLSKRWYVEFGAWNPTTEEVEKKKLYCPAKFKTEKQRELWGRDVCHEINIGLRKGAVMANEIQAEAPVKLFLVAELNNTLQTLRGTLREKSIVTYNSALIKFSSFVKQIDPNYTIDQFTNKLTYQFRDYLVSELKNSSRTANNTIEHLHTIYKHLELRESVPESPFKVKKLKEEVTSKNIAFSNADRECVEKYMIENEPELYLLTRFIYFAFIRPGELHQLTLADVRLEDNYILVRGTISKNGKTETVPIIPPLFRELSLVNITNEKQFYYLFGKGLVPSRYVSAKQVAFRRHEKVLKACGLQDAGYTLYSWKHTGAVNAYRSGVGVKELQKLLRHSSIQITDIYLKSLGLRTDPNLGNYSW